MGVKLSRNLCELAACLHAEANLRTNLGYPRANQTSIITLVKYYIRWGVNSYIVERGADIIEKLDIIIHMKSICWQDEKRQSDKLFSSIYFAMIFKIFQNTFDILLIIHKSSMKSTMLRVQQDYNIIFREMIMDILWCLPWYKPG